MGATKCGESVSSFLSVSTGVSQGCVLAPSFFNTCMDWILGRVVELRHCVWTICQHYRFFADDPVNFYEVTGGSGNCCRGTARGGEFQTNPGLPRLLGT